MYLKFFGVFVTNITEIAIANFKYYENIKKNVKAGYAK